MPTNQSYTCAKCGESKDGNVDASTAIYVYRGKGKDKKRANDVVCTNCTGSLFAGWKFPLNFAS